MAVKVKMVRKDDELPSDVIIVTSDGQRIVASSNILASSSPVLERKIKKAKKGWKSECRISLLGVSSDAIVAFVKLLYLSRTTEFSTIETDESLDKHGMQILALAHAYRIGWLKKQCEVAISTFLTPERVIDTLKLAKLLDAPRLHQQCLRLVRKDFDSVQKTEGWLFVRLHDPELELEILEFLEDFDERKRRWKKANEAQEAYRQLGEAMDCLEQIFTKGIMETRPDQSQTYQGLKFLLSHFAKCGKKLTNRACMQCNRMQQLLRLHADICDHANSCKVPICKMKVETEEKFDETWRLLVENVTRARVLSSLASRKKPDRAN
ncbi:hypothetical protein LUZ60_004524 [Juncus effusus]|nr:hypothetical protein LUZ60_004524 [Juncus effusus]